MVTKLWEVGVSCITLVVSRASSSNDAVASLDVVSWCNGGLVVGIEYGVWSNYVSIIGVWSNMDV